MKKLFSKISSMLMSEDGVNWSSMRFNMVFVSILCNLTYWGAWTYVCIKGKELVDMPATVTMAYLSIMGVVLGAKIVQSKICESSSEKENQVK